MSTWTKEKVLLVKQDLWFLYPLIGFFMLVAYCGQVTPQRERSGTTVHETAELNAVTPLGDDETGNDEVAFRHHLFAQPLKVMEALVPP